MTEKQATIALCAVSPLLAHRLWQAGHEDSAWPKNLASWDSFLQFYEEYQALAVLNFGEMFIADRASSEYHSDPLGFVLFNRIDSTWLPHGQSAVECGTYLLPPYRGTGVNLLVKTALLARAFQDYQTDWAVFIVSESNLRARRAMARLPWEFRLETPNSAGPFTRYLRRKSWETGEPCELYAVGLPAVLRSL